MIMWHFAWCFKAAQTLLQLLTAALTAPRLQTWHHCVSLLHRLPRSGRGSSSWPAFRGGGELWYTNMWLCNISLQRWSCSCCTSGGSQLVNKRNPLYAKLGTWWTKWFTVTFFSPELSRHSILHYNYTECDLNTYGYWRCAFYLTSELHSRFSWGTWPKKQNTKDTFILTIAEKTHLFPN